MKDFLEQNQWLVYPLHVVLIGIIVLFSWLLLKDAGIFEMQVGKDNTAFVVPHQVLAELSTPTPAPKALAVYLRVIGGCGIHFSGACVAVHSGPGVSFPVIAQLRHDIVLKVGESQVQDGVTWYKIVFDEGLRYPERVKNAWYVSGDGVEVFTEGSRPVPL